jgi:acetyltransferase-like isoleucine patch superfamily enzyme
MGYEEFVAKVKRGETPFYARLNRAARAMIRAEAPYVPALHRALYHERAVRIQLWRDFWRAFYYQPLFRSRCVECGKGLHIDNSGQGLPYIEGDVAIHFGDNVSIVDRAAIVGLTVAGEKRLRVGDSTDIATPVAIFVGREVSIGSHCIIAATLISDNPGHRMDYLERRDKRVASDSIGRVIIGDDVWVGQQSMIIGNVRVGDGAIIGARAFVKKDVPPFCVVAGIPARLIKKLPFPQDLIEKLGEEQYRAYSDALIGK